MTDGGRVQDPYVVYREGFTRQPMLKVLHVAAALAHQVIR
jgi:hypothetical protein